MSFRILRDAAPVEGGGNPAAPPAPAPAAPQPPAPAPTIALPADEVTNLYAAARRLADFEAQSKRDIEAKEAERLKALAQKGEVDKAFDTYKANAEGKFSALEQRYIDRERSLVVADALAGRSFVSPEAAHQVKELLGLRVEAVVDAAGAVAVRDKATGRPAGDVIKELLDSPAFAHYQPPKTTGGAGASGGGTPPPAPAGAPASPEAAIVAQWKAARQPGGDTPLWMQPRPGR